MAWKLALFFVLTPCLTSCDLYWPIDAVLFCLDHNFSVISFLTCDRTPTFLAWIEPPGSINTLRASSSHAIIKSPTLFCNLNLKYEESFSDFVLGEKIKRGQFKWSFGKNDKNKVTPTSISLQFPPPLLPLFLLPLVLHFALKIYTRYIKQIHFGNHDQVTPTTVIATSQFFRHLAWYLIGRKFVVFGRYISR